ncbi:uncharacterized protein BDR25DRAFT_387215 [Lindgomyces ingoldianus]|uniref:Uncharacterized protein n=1 Tax=Lindgomyces ingoldianus TaxID=673940 RepID=A0ACB6R1G6_9PLEO|nr:uncharacterized protein BDR25DRAFT_387215 [Lindgomyces ingoldianus]KAF2473098.1 hypothetical protein BDR25DRAFT_387215 [Lindgomyces ingoldianus]
MGCESPATEREYSERPGLREWRLKHTLGFQAPHPRPHPSASVTTSTLQAGTAFALLRAAASHQALTALLGVSGSDSSRYSLSLCDWTIASRRHEKKRKERSTTERALATSNGAGPAEVQATICLLFWALPRQVACLLALLSRRFTMPGAGDAGLQLLQLHNLVPPGSASAERSLPDDLKLMPRQHNDHDALLYHHQQPAWPIAGRRQDKTSDTVLDIVAAQQCWQPSRPNRGCGTPSVPWLSCVWRLSGRTDSAFAQLERLADLYSGASPQAMLRRISFGPLSNDHGQEPPSGASYHQTPMAVAYSCKPVPGCSCTQHAASRITMQSVQPTARE